MKKEKKIFLHDYIEDNTKSCDVSYRGGILKVDLSGLLSGESLEAIDEAGEEAEAGASQNYLGGGIAGSITTGRSFDVDLLIKKDLNVYEEFSEAVKLYFYNINNGGGDDYMQENYSGLDNNQKRPVSAY